MNKGYIAAHLLEEGEQLTIFSSIIYIASGNATIKNEENKWSPHTLAAGKAEWIQNDTIIHNKTTKLLKVYSIYMEDFSFFRKVSFAIIEPCKITSELDDLLLLQRNTGFHQQCQVQSRLWGLLAKWTDHHHFDELEETITYINAHLHKNITVRELAEKARMTPTSFARAFKKKTDQSPKDFLIERKMTKAKELIVRNKGIAIREVAQQIGIQDEFYFSRLFKKREGVAPTIFVNRVEGRVAVISQLFLQDHLLALGVQPVAAPMYPTIFPKTNGVPSYLLKQMEGTLLLNAEKEFNSKELLQTNPDTIIKTCCHYGEQKAITWANREEVQAIPLQTSWQDYLCKIASLVGKEQKAGEIKQEILQIEDDAKKQIRRITKGGEWAVIWAREKEVRLYGYKDHACMELLYHTLGFNPPPGIPSSGYKTISGEELISLDPDHILFLWSSKAGMDYLVKQPYWKDLKAVRNNNIHIPNSMEWDPWGPLGRKNMIKQLVSYFQQKKLLV